MDDNYTVIDIGVAVGTRFVAAAPVTITNYEILSGTNGRPVHVIEVDYNNGYSGRYAHARLLSNIKMGDTVEQCTPFGSVEKSDKSASHLHFEVVENSVPVDSYDSKVKPTGVLLWEDGKNWPQYCI